MDISSLFFSLEYRDIPDLILRCVLLLLASALALWLIYLALVKFFPAKKKSNAPREFVLKLRLLAALALFLIVFSIYIYFVIKSAKPSDLQLGQPTFYLALLPQFIGYVGAIIFFVIHYNRYMKTLKKIEVSHA
jgi:RsiW-degrading membrane proteinase PrsW (M82 family)